MKYIAYIDNQNIPDFNNTNFARNKLTGNLIHIKSPVTFQYMYNSFNKNLDYLNITICSINKNLNKGDKVYKDGRIVPLTSDKQVHLAKKNNLFKVIAHGKDIPNDIVTRLAANNTISNNIVFDLNSTNNVNETYQEFYSNEKDILPKNIYDNILRRTNELLNLSNEIEYSKLTNINKVSDSLINDKLTAYLSDINHMLYRSSPTIEISTKLETMISKLSDKNAFHSNSINKYLKDIKRHLNYNTVDITNINTKTMNQEFNGIIAQKPELKYTNNGIPVTNVTLFHNQGTGNEPPLSKKTTMWGEMAQFVSENLDKGDWIAVSGQLKSKQWEKDGNKGTDEWINVSELKFSKEVKFDDFEISRMNQKETKQGNKILELYAKNKDGSKYRNFSIYDDVDKMTSKLSLGDKIEVIGKPKVSTYFTKDQSGINIPNYKFDCNVTGLACKEKDFYMAEDPTKDPMTIFMGIDKFDSDKEKFEQRESNIYLKSIKKQFSADAINISNLNNNTMNQEFNGNMAQKPELKYTNNGIPVTNVTLFHNQGTGNEPPLIKKTTMWGEMAQFANENFDKGDWIAVSGQLKSKQWEKDGKKGTDEWINVSELKTGKEVKYDDFEISRMNQKETKQGNKILELYAKNKDGSKYQNFSIYDDVDKMTSKLSLGDKIEVIGKPKVSTYFTKDQSGKNIPNYKFDCNVTGLACKEKGYYMAKDPINIENGKEFNSDKEKYQHREKNMNKKPSNVNDQQKDNGQGKNTSVTAAKKNKPKGVERTI